MKDNNIYTAVEGQTAYMRVRKKGSFMNSHQIKQWLSEKIEEGYTRLVIDLHDCRGMDSTFMGVITGLSIKMRKLNRLPLTLANVSSHNRRLLETLGLNKFLLFDDNLKINESLKWDKLLVDPLDKLSVAEHMIKAHEQLIDTGTIAEQQFKSVHKMLKKDVEKRRKEMDEKED